ncbi:putative ribonuclease H-like domain-containing protein [Tanacetum coccineum]
MVKPIWNNAQRVNHENFAKKTYPYSKKNMVPRVVLMKSGLVLINTARQVNAVHTKTTMNATKPMSYLSKLAHSSTIKKLMEDMLLLEETPKEGKSHEKLPLKLLIDKSQVLLRVPRKNNMYSVDLKNIVPKGGLTCLFAKATSDESKLWHRKLGHLNFKTMNKLVKGNLVRGLPSKLFENDETCVACQKGKQHRASFVTDDYSRFTWVFFLTTKDETSGILKSFITRIENLVDHKVKVIRCDNGIEFKNREMSQFYKMKGILRQYSIARTPQQNGVGTQFNGFADLKSSHDDGSKPSSDDGKKVDEDPRHESESDDQEKADNVNDTNNINTISSTINVAGINEVNAIGKNTSNKLLFDPDMHDLEYISTFNFLNDDEDDGVMADMNNLDTTIKVSPTPTTRIPKDHPLDQVIGDTLVDLPNGKRAIGTKWVFKNKKDERGIVIRNKERLVAQGYTQEKGIDYDEVFAPVTRIEAIRLFLAYASFKEFVVYQMDVKSVFLFGKIEEEVYACQPLGFGDLDFPDKVYKTLFIKRHKGDILLVQVYVNDIIFGSTKKELCNAFEKVMHENFQMSSMGELTFFLGLQVKQKNDGIFISQDKYVTEILKKFGFTEVKTASTPMETQKPLLKDEDGVEVDVHMYRSMIGSLMYLTSSRLDIMIAVCACARYQFNPKVSHLHAVKRISRISKENYYIEDGKAIWNGIRVNTAGHKLTTAGSKLMLLSITYYCQLKVNAASYNLLLFWSTAKTKTINGEAQIHAMVDGKKVIISETSIRRDLQLADEECVKCLPNSTIFEQLALMGFTMPKSKDYSLE